MVHIQLKGDRTIDPISIALVSFTAIKKGIALGKDISSMSKDINSLFSFIDGAKEAHKKNDKNDPLSSYIAYEKAKDFERDLRKVIIDSRGMSGWNKFQEFRKQAKEQHRKSKYAAMQRKEQIMTILSVTAGVLIFVAGAVGIILFAKYLKDS